MYDIKNLGPKERGKYVVSELLFITNYTMTYQVVCGNVSCAYKNTF